MFDRICAELRLGALTSPPVRLSGGFTHRMFRLDTTTGAYAVKLLNPEIMRRPDAMDNYRTAEHFEALLEQENLPILPAKMIGGRKMQCVDGQYLYVFDYFAGRALQPEEITPFHCARVGETLARIHGTLPLRHPPQSGEPAAEIPWNELAANLLDPSEMRGEGMLLQAALPLLEDLTSAARDAARRLSPMEALCHNDMDPKNVLWQGDDFRVIDLECLGFADPRQELIDLAIAWGGEDEACFKAFAEAYRTADGIPLTDASLVHDSRRNDLDWLAYNARRALFDDPEERRVAQMQIRATLMKLQADAAARETRLQWLYELA